MKNHTYLSSLLQLIQKEQNLNYTKKDCIFICTEITRNGSIYFWVWGRADRHPKDKLILDIYIRKDRDLESEIECDFILKPFSELINDPSQLPKNARILTIS